jgi:hypothetical protein
MKELYATAGGTTPASLERCFELLSAIEGYPRWYPDGFLSAESLERDADGLTTKARATLHFGHAPLIKQFPLHLSVVTERLASVELRRMPEHLTEGARGRRIDVELRAHLALPRFLPIGGMAESLARNFVEAAVSALN